jgi:carbonic anhydrase
VALLDDLLRANQAFAATPPPLLEAAPSRHLTIVTCMDTRIDVLAALGLEIGQTHILRNAGGRVTDDTLRSLALSTHALGVDTAVIMQHTKCGLAGVPEEELRAVTGADVNFLAIGDHQAALRHDVELLSTTPFLTPLVEIAGILYDVDTGSVTEVVRWQRANDE